MSSKTISLNRTDKSLSLVNYTVPELVCGKKPLFFSVLTYKCVFGRRGNNKEFFAITLE